MAEKAGNINPIIEDLVFLANAIRKSRRRRLNRHAVGELNNLFARKRRVLFSF